MPFELSYAGVPFNVSNDPDWWAWIDRHLCLDHFQDLLPSLPAWKTRNLEGLAVPVPPRVPTLKVGHFYYPTGASRYGIFYGLSNADSALEMQAAALTGGSTVETFNMVGEATGPAGLQGLTQSISTDMYMLPPRPLANLSSKLAGMYLITLVDQRYYWQFRSAGILHVSLTTQWTDIISQLTGALGVSIPAFDTSAYGQPEPDSDLYTNDELASILLDATLANLGRVLVRNLDGTFAALSPTDGATANAANVQVPIIKLAGGDIFGADTLGDMGDPLSAVLPSTVRVTFPKYINPTSGPTSWVNPRDGTRWILDSYGDVYESVVNLSDTTITTVGNGWEKIIHDTAKAVVPDSMTATPTNKTALDALAKTLATDYWNWQLFNNHISFPGIRLVQQDGKHDVLWYYGDGQTTTLLPKPWNFGVQEMQHFLPPVTISESSVADEGINFEVESDHLGSGDTAIDPFPSTFVSINEASGLKLTNESMDIHGNPNVALIAAQDASYTHSGVVNLGNQEFRGVKTFYNPAGPLGINIICGIAGATVQDVLHIGAFSDTGHLGQTITSAQLAVHGDDGSTIIVKISAQEDDVSPPIFRGINIPSDASYSVGFNNGVFGSFTADGHSLIIKGGIITAIL